MTGSAGLIGTALRSVLPDRGYSVERFDLRGNGVEIGDTRDLEGQKSRVAGCVGRVNPASASRVVWGGRDPKADWQANVLGARNVIDAALAARPRPLVLFASSRELYGQPATPPVSGDAPLPPVNVYGRSQSGGRAARPSGARVRTDYRHRPPVQRARRQSRPGRPGGPGVRTRPAVDLRSVASLRLHSCR